MIITIKNQKILNITLDYNNKRIFIKIKSKKDLPLNQK